MDFVITIDTEEDNWGWSDTSAPGTTNIDRIPRMQELFDSFGVKPTYFLSYPVATSKRCIGVLSKIFREGRADIGTHCHPWNTPPFEELRSERNSMLCNLPADLQYKKIEVLHKTIQDSFGISPTMFRAGRWGFSWEMATVLRELGYTVDSSMTPYTDWSRYHGPDFSYVSPDPFLFVADDGSAARPTLMEVPAGVGYLQGHSDMCQRIHKFLTRKGVKAFGFAGILARCRIMNKAWFSPEVADDKIMKRLAAAMEKENRTLINLTFHSTSLKEGLSPFVKTSEELKRFFKTMHEFLRFIKETHVRPIRLNEATCSVKDPYSGHMKELEVACAE